MKKMTKKWQIFLYAMSGLGINMLNLIMGSYLCDALLIDGFAQNVENWTYFNKNIVIAGIWAIIITIAKIIDGVVDIPLAAVIDNFKSKFGRRRPTIFLGLIGVIICFVLFLFPLENKESSALNTAYLGVILCLFYVCYTFVMTSYYSSFAEIVEDDQDRLLLSNYKSAFDIVYFAIGYAIIPLMIGNFNIRIISFIMLPLAGSMIIPLFMIKEDSSKHLQPGEKEVGMVKSIACTFKNRRFIQWMIAFCFMQFGLQLFIAGQNVYYSGVLKFTGVNIFLMTVFAFGPVPLTLILYNKIVNKKGFKFGFIYSLICFIIAMVLLAICNEKIISNLTIRLIISCIGGLCCSFGLGTFFSVGYIIPSSLAESERKATGVNNSAMYFAVQGFFSGVSAALATGIIWVNLKRFNLTWTMTIVSALAMMICLVITLFLPKSLNNIGKID